MFYSFKEQKIAFRNNFDSHIFLTQNISNPRNHPFLVHYTLTVQEYRARAGSPGGRAGTPQQAANQRRGFIILSLQILLLYILITKSNEIMQCYSFKIYIFTCIFMIFNTSIIDSISYY